MFFRSTIDLPSAWTRRCARASSVDEERSRSFAAWVASRKEAHRRRQTSITRSMSSWRSRKKAPKESSFASVETPQGGRSSSREIDCDTTTTGSRSNDTMSSRACRFRVDPSCCVWNSCARPIRRVVPRSFVCFTIADSLGRGESKGRCPDESLGVGEDTMSPVHPGYRDRLPFRFTGRIDRVEMHLEQTERTTEELIDRHLEDY